MSYDSFFLSLCLALSLSTLPSYLPTFLQISQSLPPSPFFSLHCAHAPTDVQLSATAERGTVNSKVGDGEHGYVASMEQTLLHNEQTALGRDGILILYALLTKAGLLKCLQG